MPKLNLAPLSGGRVAVSVDGDAAKCHAARFDNTKHYDAAAKSLGVAVRHVVAAVTAFKADNNATTYETTTPPGSVTLTVRGLHCQTGETITDAPAAAFAKALAVKIDEPEPIITWSNTDHVAALDVDFPGEGVADYLVLLDKLDPTPLYCWLSHGGGLRGIYIARDDATAAELAAVAALNLTRFAPEARYEILNTTRHPGYKRGDEACGPVQRREPSGGVEAVRGYFGEVVADEGGAAKWLEDNGYAVGQRYPHTRCPVNPSDHGKRDPVQVGERSIYCHVCHANGICHGSRNPGLFPYAALTGAAKTRGRLSLCVTNCVHWDHARHLWADAVPGQPESVLRAMYSAALRLEHGADDPRIPAVFAAGKNVLRFDGYWGNHVGQTFRNRVSPILAALPATWGKDGKIIAERVARFEQTADISDFGYVPLQPIWGIEISAAVQDAHRSAVPMLLHTKILADETLAPYRPRYRPPGQRPSDAEAWQTIESLCPGIERNYVRLLIAAKGCVELGASMPPLIFAHGTSGAAKTATVSVAAGICGDTSRRISLCRDEDRFRMGIMEARDCGTFVSVDEALKDARKDRIDPVAALNPLLKLTSLSTSHKLYQGPVPMGTVPVVVLTDVELADGIRNDQQLGRRMVEVPLSGEKQWADLWNACNCDGTNIRLIDESYCLAADAILSGVVDEFFNSDGPPPSFFAVAKRLGFRLIRESAVELDAVLRDFFAEVCAAPDASATVQRRCHGRGWKVIQQGGETKLSDLWEALRDGHGFTSSRQCSAADWRRVIGVHATFESKPITGGVAVRFIHRESQKTYAVNDELATVERGADGRGDAVGREPAASWCDGLPTRLFDTVALGRVSLPAGVTIDPDLD